MALQPTRRRVLRSGGVLAATALAGCSALPGNGSGDPDAGTDSYGIRLQNDTEKTHSVTITAEPHGDEPTFDRTVESNPDEPREWNQVLTDDRIYVVRATVDDDHFIEELSENVLSVSVGAENSIDAKNVFVTIEPMNPGIVANVVLGRPDA